jgi:hypothetical protein
MSLKNCGMRIRLEKELREAFVEACRSQNIGASDVLRDFMRVYTDKHYHGQTDLFCKPKEKAHDSSVVNK